MSALPARQTLAEQRPASSTRPSLRVVPAPAPARSVVPYLLLCAVILLGSLVGALLLNTQMTVAAHEIHELQGTLSRERETESSLRQQAELAGSPSRLEERAEDLGMVPAEEIAFIDLEAGEIRRVTE